MFELDFVAQGLRISVPYVLAALGGMFSERGGVINIALEGMLLGGAFAFVLGSHMTGSPWVGLLFGAGAGVLLAALHALMTITLRGEQIVSGVALNFLVLGMTKFGLQLLFHSASNSPRVTPFESLNVPVLRDLPALGDVLTHPIVIIMLLGIGVAHVVLYKTRFGLRLRAVGEHPRAAESLGVSVLRLRYAGVLLSGLLAGVGGAYLASEQASFTAGMSAGRGYIALAAMIVGKWRPGAAALSGALFGFAEALQIRMQSIGVDVPPQLIQIIPYALTLLVLCGFIGRAVPPRAIGKPFDREVL